MKLSVGDLHMLHYLAVEATKDPKTKEIRAGEMVEDAMRGEV